MNFVEHLTALFRRGGAAVSGMGTTGRANSGARQYERDYQWSFHVWIPR
jgi:hypothetical protein